jgi:quinol monooxygenase YgiN
MVIGFVIIRTKPDRRDDVLREYQAVVPMVLEERGCIDYGAVVDEYFGPPQSLLGDDAFAIIEKWETKQHFESHAVSEHMKTCRAKVAELVVDRTFHLLSLT